MRVPVFILFLCCVRTSLCDSVMRCENKVCYPECDKKGHCICDQGYDLSEDHKTCLDYDECQHWPPACSQICVNHVGSFECDCAKGYHMVKQWHECHSNKPTSLAQLVYSTGSDLYALPYYDGVHNVSHHQHRLLHKADGIITSITVNAVDQEIYFFDEGSSHIDSVRLSPDAAPVYKKGIVANGLESVSGIAWDWIGRNLYVLESKDHVIYVCSVDTDQCLALVSHLQGKPRSVAVDPNNGFLYWSECIQPYNRIMVAPMDGGEPRELWNTKGRCAANLIVDETTSTLLWTDEQANAINTIALTGVNMRSLVSQAFDQPQGLAIFEEWIFWTSRGHDGPQINNLPKTLHEHTPTHEYMYSSSDHGPYNLAILHPTLQSTNDKERCSKLSCSDICLLTGDAAHPAKCACPNGELFNEAFNSCEQNWSEPSLLAVKGNRILRVMPLNVGERVHEVAVVTNHHVTAIAADSTNRDVILAELKDGDPNNGFVIVRINLQDINNVTVLVSDDGYVSSITLDWIAKNFYWVNSKKGRIEMKRMNGESHHIFGDKNLIKNPNAIAVDPLHNQIYFSNCGSENFLGSCDLGGERCQRLNLAGVVVGCGGGLVVDSSPRILYWTDPSRSTVAAHAIGTENAVILRNSPQPSQLALFSTNLFWTDPHEDDILSHRKSTKEHGGRIRLGLAGVDALASIDSFTQPPGQNGCSAENGGCSGICVAEGQMRRRCLCPTGSFLQADQKTCAKEYDHPETTTKKDVLEVLQKFYRPGPKLECPNSFCPAGITCQAISHRNFKCICPDGWEGAKCDVKVSGSNQWAVVLFIVWLFITVTAVCAFGAFKIYNKMKEGQAMNFKELKNIVLTSGKESADSKSLIKKDRETANFVDVVVLPTGQDGNRNNNN